MLDTTEDSAAVTIEEKRQLELVTMKKIIHMYCRKKHSHCDGTLCDACSDVWQYAQQRINACPHMAHKTFCSACKTHCYETTYRERIREIMRYGGPRLLFDSPMMVLRHMFIEWKEKHAQ